MKYVSKKILFFRIKLILLIFITSILYNSVFPDYYNLLRYVTLGLLILWDLYYQKNNMEEIVEYYRQNYALEGSALEHKIKQWERVGFRIQLLLGILILLIGIADAIFNNNKIIYMDIKTTAMIMLIFSVLLFAFSKRLFNSLPEGYPGKTKKMFILVRISIVILFIIFLAIFVRFY